MAAKTLLHNAPDGDAFRVSVFDTQHDVGGLWPTSRTDSGRQVHPLMVANQSKHTMHFSDQVWDDDAPQFPLAWMVGKYLARYTDRYLKGHTGFDLRLDSRVVKATPREGGFKGWDVVVQANGVEETRVFDHVVVAAGFFGKPIIPKQLQGTHDVPVIHSSAYRDLEGLLGQARLGGGKILIVGGQMSGVEIAGTIAAHLSSAANSPEKSKIKDVENYSIHHVVQRPTWVLPLFTSPEVRPNNSLLRLLTDISAAEIPGCSILAHGLCVIQSQQPPSPTRQYARTHPRGNCSEGTRSLPGCFGR